MMGHEFKERGDGIHQPSALVYKNLRAPATIAWATKRRNSKQKSKVHEQPKDDVEATGTEEKGEDEDMGYADVNRKRGSDQVVTTAATRDWS